MKRWRRAARAGLGVGYPALAALRVLLPTWRFFDEITPSLALQARVAHDAADFGGWRQIMPEPNSAPRPLRALLFDPEGNLRLAYHGLLERLQSDLSELPDDDGDAAQRLVSYALVLNLVRHALAAAAPPKARFQFRLTAGAQAAGAEDADPEVVLRSAVHVL